MVRGRALVSTAIFAIALVAGVAALLNLPAASGRTFQVEFTDAFPLVPGADVLMWGAKVGSVTSMKLTNHGTVSVQIRLLDGVSAPRSDASVSVRAGDLLGSAYLALSPGRSARPLQGPLPPGRSFVATSVQDFLNSNDQPTRQALSIVLNELGVAIDARGTDLNRAVLELAPAIQEATRLTAQVSDQNAHLEDLIGHARLVTREIAPRTADLERLIDGFDRTFNTTAANSTALDRGLAGLPASLLQTQSTLTQLGLTAAAARPLAGELLAATPTLLTATQRLGPFATDATVAVGSLRPLVRQLGATLAAGTGSFPRLARSLRTTRSVAPDLVRFSAVFDPLINMAVKGSFGGLGRLAGEPGTQPFESLPGRNWFRTVGVLGCESFGVPTAPGCLADLVGRLASVPASSDTGTAAKRGLANYRSSPSAAARSGARRLAPARQPRPTGAPPPIPAAPPRLAGSAQAATQLLQFLLGR